MWNAVTVRSIFNDEDANQVLWLRISMNANDKLMWAMNNSGQFSRKSAYKLLMGYQFNPSNLVPQSH